MAARNRCWSVGRLALAAVAAQLAAHLAGAPALAAQASPPAPPAPAAPAAPAASVVQARPADVASVDAIIDALYGVISGGAGEARDWDRFHSLFVPEARLIPTGQRADGTRTHRTMSVEDYVRNVGPQLERGGFFERELGRREARYGNIVHLMSAYDSKRSASDAQPFARGVNSIQLWFDGARWWVVTIFWESETPANPLPADLLRKP